MTALEARMAEIVAQAQREADTRELNLLNEPAYVNVVLGDKDSEILDEMLKNIQTAYGDKKIYPGYTFDVNTEKIVAIVSSLTFAKAEVRDLIPAEYYTILSRPICDMVIQAYGRLPYFKEAITLELADGTTKVLDPDSITRNMAGIPINVEELNVACKIVASKLKLISTLNITQAKADSAWAAAKAKAERGLELHKLQEELANA